MNYTYSDRKELATRLADFYHDYDYYDYDDNYAAVGGGHDHEKAINDCMEYLKHKEKCLEIYNQLVEAQEEAEPSLQGTAIYLAGKLKDFIKDEFI